MERNEDKRLESPILGRFSFLAFFLVLGVFFVVLGIPYLAKDQTNGINKYPIEEPKFSSGETRDQNLDDLYQDQISARLDQNLDDLYADQLPLNSATS